MRVGLREEGQTVHQRGGRPPRRAQAQHGRARVVFLSGKLHASGPLGLHWLPCKPPIRAPLARTPSHRMGWVRAPARRREQNNTPHPLPTPPQKSRSVMPYPLGQWGFASHPPLGLLSNMKGTRGVRRAGGPPHAGFEPAILTCLCCSNKQPEHENFSNFRADCMI